MQNASTATIPMKIFQGHRVRWQLRRSVLWICRCDACRVLQLREDETDDWLDPDEQAYLTFLGVDGREEGLVGVSFEGFLTLVEHSRVPHARAFRHWVNYEILSPLLHARHTASLTIDSPVSNWEVRMQKQHWFRAATAIYQELSKEDIKRYGVDRIKGITDKSPNYWREYYERWAHAFRAQVPNASKLSAIDLVRLFAEVDSVVIGLTDDIVGLGVFERNVSPPWQRAIDLAKEFKAPMRALYNAGVRLEHEEGSTLALARQSFRALPGISDAVQGPNSPLFAPERWRPEPLTIMPQARHSEFYVTYMASPEWAAIRAEVLGRAQDVCEWCQERRAREVHHLTYAHLGDEKDHLDELVALCQACHDWAHEQRRDRLFWRRAEGYAKKIYGELWELLISRSDLAEEFESWLEARHPEPIGNCGTGCVPIRTEP